MTGKSGRGTARQTVRIDEAEWAAFGAFCEEHGTDRSVVLRAYISQLMAGKAKLPKLPEG